MLDLTRITNNYFEIKNLILLYIKQCKYIFSIMTDLDSFNYDYVFVDFDKTPNESEHFIIFNIIDKHTGKQVNSIRTPLAWINYSELELDEEYDRQYALRLQREQEQELNEIKRKANFLITYLNTGGTLDSTLSQELRELLTKEAN